MGIEEFEAENQDMLEAVSSAAASTQGGAARGRDSTACRTATRNLANQQSLLNGFNIAVFAVAIAVVISLIVAITMLFLGKAGGAIAGGVGTIVTGTAMGFVLAQRNDARKQVAALTRLRDRYCSIES
jgi:hypothetical protein